MSRMILVLAGLVLLPTAGWTQPTSPLEKYRKLEFPPKDENFAKGWQDRVALEYEIINAADLKALRIALKDEDPFVRAIAARALGILGDNPITREIVTSSTRFRIASVAKPITASAIFR